MKIIYFPDNKSSINFGGDFKYAIDLIKFVIKYFKDKFCICVAGYPEMHPESKSKDEDLQNLKAKVKKKLTTSF